MQHLSEKCKQFVKICVIRRRFRHQVVTKDCSMQIAVSWQLRDAPVCVRLESRAETKRSFHFWNRT